MNIVLRYKKVKLDTYIGAVNDQTAFTGLSRLRVGFELVLVVGIYTYKIVVEELNCSAVVVTININTIAVDEEIITS